MSDQERELPEPESTEEKWNFDSDMSGSTNYSSPAGRDADDERGSFLSPEVPSSSGRGSGSEKKTSSSDSPSSIVSIEKISLLTPSSPTKKMKTSSPDPKPGPSTETAAGYSSDEPFKYLVMLDGNANDTDASDQNLAEVLTPEDRPPTPGKKLKVVKRKLPYRGKKTPATTEQQRSSSSSSSSPQPPRSRPPIHASTSTLIPTISTPITSSSSSSSSTSVSTSTTTLTSSPTSSPTSTPIHQEKNN